MTEEEVIKILYKNDLLWSDFKKWMIGQTVSSDKDGNTIYYEHDVVRFVFYKKQGKNPPIWD